MKIHGTSLSANVEETVHCEISALTPKRPTDALRGGLETTRRGVFFEARANRFHGNALACEPCVELLTHKTLDHERSPGVSDENAPLESAAPSFSEEKFMVNELVGDGLRFCTRARADGVHGGLNLSDGNSNVPHAGVNPVRMRDLRLGESRRRLEEQQE